MHAPTYQVGGKRKPTKNLQHNKKFLHRRHLVQQNSQHGGAASRKGPCHTSAVASRGSAASSGYWR